MKLPIKTKKDWIIAFSVLFIALYYITLLKDYKIRDFMMRFSPDKLNLMNYPGGWGNFLVTGLLMTIIITIVMLLLKVRIKRIILAASGGLLFSLLMLTGFIIHTNLIVGTSKVMEPTNIWITDYNNMNLNLKSDSSLVKEFIDKAIELKAKPDQKQEKLKSGNKSQSNSCHIWISYPKKYGQSYDYIFYIDDDLIYSFHGNGTSETRVFYEDNGLIELLRQIEEQNAGA